MNDKSATATAATLFAAGAFALVFGQGHWPNGGALLVGIILWVRFFRVAKPLIAVPIVSVANVVIWEFAFAGMVPLATPIRIGMFAAISLTFALLYLADRWANRRIDSLAATLVLPAGWTAFDLASARFSPGGTWASIAYSYVEQPVLAQVASLAGWTSVTFVVVWIATTINWTWDRRSRQGAMRPGLAAIAVVVIAVFGFGVSRLSTGDIGQSVRVACVVAPNTYNDEFLDDVYDYTRGIDVPESSTTRARTRIAESLQEHFDMVEVAAKLKPDVIIWAEANAVLTLAEEDEWIQRAQQVASDNQVYVGMGMIVFRPGTGKGTLNKFVLVDPTTQVVIDTLKATRVPGSRNAKGDGILPVVRTDLGNLSGAICFDMDFPHLIAQAGRSHIDLFFAPSNDWLEVAEIHAQMARMRAIEQGFSLVRPTKDGTTLITNSTGQTVASMTLSDNRTGLLVGDVRMGRRFTLYSVLGDAFGFLCGFVFVALLAATRFSPRLRKSEPAPRAS